jgi:hypothetical protein
MSAVLCVQVLQAAQSAYVLCYEARSAGAVPLNDVAAFQQCYTQAKLDAKTSKGKQNGPQIGKPTASTKTKVQKLLEDSSKT